MCCIEKTFSFAILMVTRKKTAERKGEILMKLKTAKNLLLLSCLIMAILLVICSVTKILWLGYLGIAFVFAGAFIWILFGRCPSCGRFLGKVDNKYCPHCGERIEW